METPQTTTEAGLRSAMAPADRILCVLGGAMLLGRGLSLFVSGRGRLAAGVMTLTGGALLGRGAMAASAQVRKVRVIKTRPIETPSAASATEVIIETRTEHERRLDDDRIDEASEESFPASDAPSWTSSGVGGPSHKPRERPR